MFIMNKISEIFLLFFRGHQIRTFVMGDYEFLCASYGLTGASGKKTLLYYKFNWNYIMKFSFKINSIKK